MQYYSYCKNKIFTSIPEINQVTELAKKSLDQIIKYDEGPHILCEDVLVPFFLQLIENYESNQKLIDRIKKLVEELAIDNDLQIKDVAKLSFAEPLLDKLAQRGIAKDIEKYLLPQSLELAKEVAVKRFGLNPDTWEKIPDKYDNK